MAGQNGGKRAQMLFVCKQKMPRCPDEDLGMMLLSIPYDHSRQYVYIDYLVTHPDHLCSALNATTRIRGIGRCLLQQAERTAFRFGKCSVVMSTMDSSANFYKAQGYNAVPTNPDPHNMEKRIWASSISGPQPTYEPLPFECD